MIRAAVFAAALFCAKLTFAEYDQFYFPTEKDFNRCKGGGNSCQAPSVCAHEALTDVHYCCTSGQKDAVCWTNSQDCRGEDSKPATGQLGCPTNKSPTGYCCRSEKEQCTLRSGQINICWATPSNPIANVSQDFVNSTYSSIVSASPSARTLTVQLAALLSTSTSSTPTPTPSSDTTSTPSTSSPSSTPNSSNTAGSNPAASNATSNDSSPDTSSSVSGGAIGGIVVGAVAGIALVGGGIFLLLRRRNNSKKPDGGPSTVTSSFASPNQTAEMDGASMLAGNNPYGNSAHAYSAVAQGPPGSGAASPPVKYAHYAGAHGDVHEAATQGGHWNDPVEMPAFQAQELDGGYAGVPKTNGPPSQ